MKTRLSIMAALLMIPGILFAVTNAGPWIALSINTNNGSSFDTRGVNFSFSNVNVFGEFKLTNTAWEDLRFPLYGLGRAGNNDPAESFVQGPGGDMLGLLFSASQQQELFGSGQMSHTWKRGTALRPHIHWTATSVNTGAVVWGVDCSMAAIGTNWTATVTAKGTNDFTDSVQWKSRIQDMGTIVPPSGATESFGIKFRVYRDAAAAADTYPDQAQGDDFDIHFEVEKLGTADEYPGP